MKLVNLASSAIAGLAFGCLVSLANKASVLPVQVLSLVVGVGWAWCAVGVIVGWRSRSWVSAMVCSTVTLVLAVVAFYATDFAFGVYGPHMDWLGMNVRAYLTAALVAGPVMGTIGYLSRSAKPMGLVARAAVPVMAIYDAQRDIMYPETLRKVVSVVVMTVASAALLYLLAQLVRQLLGRFTAHDPAVTRVHERDRLSV